MNNWHISNSANSHRNQAGIPPLMDNWHIREQNSALRRNPAGYIPRLMGNWNYSQPQNSSTPNANACSFNGMGRLTRSRGGNETQTQSATSNPVSRPRPPGEKRRKRKQKNKFHVNTEPSAENVDKHKKQQINNQSSDPQSHTFTRQRSVNRTELKQNQEQQSPNNALKKEEDGIGHMLDINILGEAANLTNENVKKEIDYLKAAHDNLMNYTLILGDLNDSISEIKNVVEDAPEPKDLKIDEKCLSCLVAPSSAIIEKAVTLHEKHQIVTSADKRGTRSGQKDPLNHTSSSRHRWEEEDDSLKSTAKTSAKKHSSRNKKSTQPKPSPQQKDKERSKRQSIPTNKSTQSTPQPIENNINSNIPTADIEKTSSIQRPRPSDTNVSPSNNEPVVNSQQHISPFSSDLIKLVCDNMGFLERKKKIDSKIKEWQVKKTFIDEQIRNFHKEKNNYRQNESLSLLRSLLTANSTRLSSQKRVCEAQLPSTEKASNHQIVIFSSDEENEIEEVKSTIATQLSKLSNRKKRRVYCDVDRLEKCSCKKIKINVSQHNSTLNIEIKSNIQQDELQSDIKPEKVKSPEEAVADTKSGLIESSSCT